MESRNSQSPTADSHKVEQINRDFLTQFYHKLSLTNQSVGDLQYKKAINLPTISGSKRKRAPECDNDPGSLSVCCCQVYAFILFRCYAIKHLVTLYYIFWPNGNKLPSKKGNGKGYNQLCCRRWPLSFNWTPDRFIEWWKSRVTRTKNSISFRKSPAQYFRSAARSHCPSSCPLNICRTHSIGRSVRPSNEAQANPCLANCCSLLYFF